MADRLLIIDSDVFILLAGTGLFDSVIALLGFKREQVRRLDALPHMLAKSQRIKRNYPPEIRANAITACDQIAPITEYPPDEQVLEALAKTPEIDPGEAVLLSHVASADNFFLASGDKRAMRALATSPALKNIRAAVAGRIICLETILRRLVDQHGVQHVASSLLVLRATHTTLRVVFGAGADTTLDNCVSALNAYLTELKTQVGDDFLLDP